MNDGYSNKSIVVNLDQNMNSKKIIDFDIGAEDFIVDSYGRIALSDYVNEEIILYDSEGNHLYSEKITKESHCFEAGGKYYTAVPNIQKSGTVIYLLDFDKKNISDNSLNFVSGFVCSITIPITIKIAAKTILINKLIINPHNKKANRYNEKHKYDIKPKMHRLWDEKIQDELPRFFSNIPVVIGKKKHKKEAQQIHWAIFLINSFILSNYLLLKYIYMILL